MSGEKPRSKRLKLDDSHNQNKKKLIVILEDCSLEAAKVGQDHVILSSDKHAHFLRKHNKDPAQYRPDILHQCLLMLMDCPLNQSGHLQVYFRTKKNVLVEINPQCRIPRTFDRFCGLMVQLLHNLQIRAAEGPERLLRVIKNPITKHLPLGCKKYLTSYNCDNLVELKEVVNAEAEEPVVMVVGGISHGKISTDYTEGEIKISNFPLSAALTCAKMTTAFEQMWGVV
ncbi:EMG1/NEP1 methyltransferase domain-containing protein [Ditylenchus destructor]|nr:EMG1/NEP1 methyltransferase domain-containing protein [Ditylenchus destructor]